jgi:hypothetical protein
MNKKSANAVLDRLQQALGVSSDSDLCKAIDVNRATLGNWRNRDSVPYSLCVNLSDKLFLSLDWLLTGRGGMYKEISINEPGNAGYKVHPSMSPGKLAELAEGLSEDQRMVVAAIIEDKKRLNELEAIVMDLQSKIKK